jgi:HD-GYP domain-containing protein (c-di-GMP phosphodiesterase class II)
MDLGVISSGGKKYYPVKVENFCQVPTHLHFSVFLKKDDKFLFANDLSFLKNISVYFKEQNIKEVYLEEHELEVYTQELIKHNQFDPSQAQNLSLLAEQTQLALWTLKRQGLNENNYKMVQSIAKSIINVGIDQKISELFSNISSGDAQLFLVRTFIAKLMCHKLKFNSESTLYKMTLVSLLCDIGKYHVKGNEYHAEVSAAKLREIKVHSEIVQAVLHHHENNDGSGPLKINKFYINPIAKILRVADEFVDQVLVQHKNRKEVFLTLQLNSPKIFDNNAVIALLSCFKI